MPEIPRLKGQARSIIIKITTGECQNQKYCHEGPQSKRLLESAKNKITSRMSQSNELQLPTKIMSGIKKECKGIITIKGTAREYHKQMYFQCVSQSKGPLKLIIIKTIACPEECQNQNNCQGTQQPKELPGSVPIKRTTR